MIIRDIHDKQNYLVLQRRNERNIHDNNSL